MSATNRSKSISGARRLLLLLRSCLFQVGFVVSTLIWAPLVLLTFPLPYKARYHFARQWGRFNVWWLEVTCGLHHTVEGMEHAPDKPTVVLAKHQSTWETLMLPALFGPQVYVLKRELLWVPFFGWAMAQLRPIAIDRSSGRVAMRQVLRQGKARLDDGCWVVIFPEGTRTAPGHRARYGMGGPLLAAHSGYPIVPIAHNAGDFWPRHSFIKYPGTIRVVIGPPIAVNDRSAQELKTLTEDWIETTVARIRGGAGQPTGHSTPDARDTAAL